MQELGAIRQVLGLYAPDIQMYQKVLRFVMAALAQACFFICKTRGNNYGSTDWGKEFICSHLKPMIKVGATYDKPVHLAKAARSA
ncbi:hypothetical protein P7H25_08755 [Paenibacillus larvae]|nr:hypothetical protein [Paenibacillus larvae]MDT2255710.1 hypothetical protein [Paenibacillus larvae]